MKILLFLVIPKKNQYFNVSNYEYSCNKFGNSDLSLEIKAYTDKEKIVTYNIPITEAKQLIEEWIYSERDRSIAVEKFINGKTHQEIAKIYNITERQIGNIISNIIKIIEKHI